MARVRVLIPLGGNPVITVEGMDGPGCSEKTAKLEAALGKTVKDVKTDDYYKVPALTDTIGAGVKLEQ